jgi:hypothetical protein
MKLRSDTIIGFVFGVNITDPHYNTPQTRIGSIDRLMTCFLEAAAPIPQPSSRIDFHESQCRRKLTNYVNVPEPGREPERIAQTG